MRAAIYARKSTDDSDRNEDARSTAHQVARAREYAKLKGWTVAEEHVYVDDAVSGAEWKNRHAFNRLLLALDGPNKPDVLIVSELSRIGRDSVRTPFFLQQIEEAGVQVWGYLSDQQISLASESGEMQVMLNSLSASSERRRASQRTRSVMVTKAKDGYVTGGKVYGYVNHRVAGHVERVVNEPEAEVVRRIFRMYADGLGMVGIAHKLNKEGVKPPRGRGWAPSGIREMLHRPLYRGEIVYGKTMKTVSGGTKGQRKRDRSEWITLPAPELRIVPEELVARVDDHLARVTSTYARSTRGTLLAKPRRRDESNYLLVSFIECSVCGGPVGTDIHNHGTTTKRMVPFYCCLTHKRQGPSRCTNTVSIRQDVLDGAVLTEISNTLDPEIISRAISLALEELTSSAATHRARKLDVVKELGEVQVRIDRLLDALADGTLPRDEIAGRLNTLKARKDALGVEIANLDRALAVADVDVESLKADALLAVDDLKNALKADVPVARQILRKLLGGAKITLEPTGEGKDRGYRFSGKLALGDILIGGSALPVSQAQPSAVVVAPRGPVWWWATRLHSR